MNSTTNISECTKCSHCSCASKINLPKESNALKAKEKLLSMLKSPSKFIKKTKSKEQKSEKEVSTVSLGNIPNTVSPATMKRQKQLNVPVYNRRDVRRRQFYKISFN